MPRVEGRPQPLLSFLYIEWSNCPAGVQSLHWSYLILVSVYNLRPRGSELTPSMWGERIWGEQYAIKVGLLLHLSLLQLCLAKMVHCPPSLENNTAVDQSSFWSSGGVNWDTLVVFFYAHFTYPSLTQLWLRNFSDGHRHRIGWAISGGCAVLVSCLVSANLNNGHHISLDFVVIVVCIQHMELHSTLLSLFSWHH